MRASAIASSIIVLVFVSCRPDMENQPRAKPLSQSDFFPDGASARQMPAHTVAWQDARENSALFTGLTNGTYVTQLPMKLTPELLERGRERFDAMCAECHDRTGSGNGMVVRRGFPQPPSFHVDRLRNAPLGHFYDVITNGYGVMYSYAARVEPDDRWAIAAYIRALQLSHNAKPSDADSVGTAKLEERTMSSLAGSSFGRAKIISLIVGVAWSCRLSLAAGSLRRAISSLLIFSVKSFSSAFRSDR